MAKRWYVAATRAGRENVAEVHLARQGFVVWSPRQKRTVRHARRRVEKLTPFFPGYLFVLLDTERQRWRSVNGTYGVRSLIMEGERPLPCPPGLVEGLQAAADSNGVMVGVAVIAPGQTVRVVSGPMTDLVGTLLSVDDRGRSRVLMSLLSSNVVVTVNAGALTPAAA